MHGMAGMRASAGGVAFGLPLLRLELAFRLRDVAWLPPFRASLWKSALGPQLKRIDETRRALPGRPRSLYDWILGAAPADALAPAAFGPPPHPLVIDAPPEADWAFAAPRSTLRLQLTLAGRLIDEWETVVRAFARAGEGGLGRAVREDGARGRARLISVHEVWRHDGARALWTAENGVLEHPLARPPTPPAPGPVRVDLVTPMRVERDGRALGPGAFGAAELFSALARRLSGLTAAETGRRREAGHFAALKAEWQAVRPLDAAFAWREVKRWSRGEPDPKDCSGVTGRLAFDLSGRPDLFDLLWFGQWTGAGRNALLGLGGVRLSPLARRDDRP